MASPSSLTGCGNQDTKETMSSPSSLTGSGNQDTKESPSVDVGVLEKLKPEKDGSEDINYAYYQWFQTKQKEIRVDKDFYYEIDDSSLQCHVCKHYFHNQFAYDWHMSNHARMAASREARREARRAARRAANGMV